MVWIRVLLNTAESQACCYVLPACLITPTLSPEETEGQASLNRVQCSFHSLCSKYYQLQFLLEAHIMMTWLG